MNAEDDTVLIKIENVNKTFTGKIKMVEELKNVSIYIEQANKMTNPVIIMTF